MERLWSYKELKEVRILQDKPSEMIARHLNQTFHDGQEARDKQSVDKVKRNLHILFK